MGDAPMVMERPHTTGIRDGLAGSKDVIRHLPRAFLPVQVSP